MLSVSTIFQKVGLKNLIGNQIDLPAVLDSDGGFKVHIQNPFTGVISGTVTANQGGNWSVRLQDGTGNLLTSSGGALDVNVKLDTVTVSENIASVSGQLQTARDWSLDFAKLQNLDITLSTLNRTLATAPFSTQLSNGSVFYDARTRTWTLGSSDVPDLMDRANRLLGVVYGSQAQQLKQTATNFNLQVELATGGTLYDARQIRALTASDVVTAQQGTSPWAASQAQVAPGTHADYWWTRQTDGTNDAVLKAASTPAAATDVSLVVALSPNSPIPTGANTIGIVNQGNAGMAGQAWFTRPTDGTNFQPMGDALARSIFTRIGDGTTGATVKAASTAPVSTDTSVVVALNPNAPLPTGSNTIGIVNQGAGGASAWLTSRNWLLTSTDVVTAQQGGAPWSQNLTHWAGTILGLPQTPADGLTNAIVSPVGIAYNMGFNGTGWDRLRSTITNGLQVDVRGINGAAIGLGQAVQAASIPVALPVDATASGTLTAAGQNVDIDIMQLDAASTVAVAITGVFVGTITFQSSVDGTTFFPVNGNNLFDSVQSTSAPGQFIFTAAWKTIRIKALSWTSGTATISSRVHMGVEVNRIVGAIPSGGNLIGHVVTDDGAASVSTTPDSSVNSFDGTLTGNVLPTLIVSPFQGYQNAIRFDGVDRGTTAANQSIDCGANGVSVNGAFTLEFKFVRTKTGVQVLGGKASTAQINLQLFLDGSNKLNARSEDNTSTVQTATSSTTVSLGKHDGAMSWDGSTTLWVYVDGVQVGSTPMTTILAPDTTTQFSIGKSQQSGGNGFPFAGTIEEVRLSNIDRYAGANYTPSTIPFIADANTVGLWHLDSIRGPIFTKAADEFVDFEAQDITLVANTDTTVTFAGGQVRLIRVLNYDTVNTIRVKNGAITSNTDTTSDKVGVAPAANVPFGEYFPYTTTTIHLRSAGASEVAVKGFR